MDRQESVGRRLAEIEAYWPIQNPIVKKRVTQKLNDLYLKRKLSVTVDRMIDGEERRPSNIVACLNKYYQEVADGPRCTATPPDTDFFRKGQPNYDSPTALWFFDVLCPALHAKKRTEFGRPFSGIDYEKLIKAYEVAIADRRIPTDHRYDLAVKTYREGGEAALRELFRNNFGKGG